METWDAIRARRNVRTYLPDPVPAADLDRIAEAGWRAPSASNRQHWDFIIVTGGTGRRGAGLTARQGHRPQTRSPHPVRNKDAQIPSERVRGFALQAQFQGRPGRLAGYAPSGRRPP
jgi:nitroreductase